MLRIPFLAAGIALAAASSALAQTVTPSQPAAGGTAGQNVVTPPAEALVPGNTGASGAPNVVLPPAETLTPGSGQTVLPPAEALVPGAPGGFPAATGTAAGTGTAGVATTGVATTTTDTGTTTTGTATTGTLGVNTAAGLTVPPAISSAQAAQSALQQGGLAPLVTEPGVAPSTQVAFFGDREGPQRQQQRRDIGGGGAAMNLVPIGTSPGSRPGAREYIGPEITPYDSDSPDALDFSRTP